MHRQPAEPDGDEGEHLFGQRRAVLFVERAEERDEADDDGSQRHPENDDRRFVSPCGIVLQVGAVERPEAECDHDEIDEKEQDGGKLDCESFAAHHAERNRGEGRRCPEVERQVSPVDHGEGCGRHALTPALRGGRAGRGFQGRPIGHAG
jgi:hypothetical protein